MILILLPLPVLSQTASINQANKTVTLDEKKTIDVAKIIENEKRLKEENERLLAIIDELTWQVQQLADENTEGLNTISNQTSQLLSLSKDIQRLTEYQLKYEEKKNYTGRLFLHLQYDLNNPYYKAGNVKASYIYNRFSYGIFINPLNENIIYGLEFGVSIF